jgi:hypothetical protein
MISTSDYYRSPKLSGTRAGLVTARLWVRARRWSTVYTVILFWAKLVRNGRIRAVEVRPQNFGRISSIAQPKNLLIWGNFAQIGKNSPEIFWAKLNCAGSPISGEKNKYCVLRIHYNVQKCTIMVIMGLYRSVLIMIHPTS